MTDSNMVFVHGWGLNKAVWTHISDKLSSRYHCHLSSLPGYGDLHSEVAPSSIDELANNLLDQAPDEPSHWCAWSLGGMAAIHAAIKQPERFKSLRLICSTPKFTADEQWENGTEIDVFDLFANELASDYERSIQRFLLLQAGAASNARSLAKQAAEAINQFPAPSLETLRAGLEILRNTDLREQLPHLQIPVQVVSGKLDRVVHPQACKQMASLIPNAQYVEMPSGHAPHLTHPNEFIELLTSSIGEAESV